MQSHVPSSLTTWTPSTLDGMEWSGRAESREEKLLEQVHAWGIALPWQLTHHSSREHTTEIWSSAHKKLLEI